MINSHPSIPDKEIKTLEGIGLRVLDEFMEYFNKADAQAMAERLHYPHIRLAGGLTQMWRTPEDYAADSNMSALREGIGWAHSAWDWRELIQADADKLHFAVSFSRYTSEKKRIASYESLYIITRRGANWGVQFRSSYAGVASANTAY